MSDPSSNIFKAGHVLNDKWVIIEFIDKGAMGEVYRAHQLSLERDVAIKVISQEMLQSLGDDPIEIEAAVQRFHREVRAMAQIRHANVLQIFDYGSDVVNNESGDTHVEYIVMEYISGATLRFTMSEEGFYPEQDLTVKWLVDYFLPLLEGVEAIHAKGIVHRDLKPENVLLDDSTPKIADFGLACSSYMAPVTRSIDVRGTPAYMSPEHYFDFKKADQQSDIYSLGRILYESIDGRITSNILPFKGVALSNHDTPFFQKMDRIVQDATAEKKEERLNSIGELRNAILGAMDIFERETTVDDINTRSRDSFFHRPGFIWTGIVIAMVSVSLMGVWHLMGEPGKLFETGKRPGVARKAPSKPDPSGPLESEKQSPDTPAPSMLGKDGITMHFIRGGELTIKKKGSDDLKRTVLIKPFYMDEKKVTYHHFVEFLNMVKEDLAVENGVVKKQDEIWLYLGEGAAPHEQIIFEHGRFHLRNIAFAAHPAVRVTWYGATAYARHYGKRLLTEYEWNYVSSNKRFKAVFGSENYGDNLSKKTVEHHGGNDAHMMHMDSSNNMYGMQDKKITNKEWIATVEKHKSEQNGSADHRDASYNSMVAGRLSHDSVGTTMFRYPWEAFADVGFRCVLDSNILY